MSNLLTEVEFSESEFAAIREAAQAEQQTLGFFIESATRDATGVRKVVVPPTAIVGFPFYNKEVA